MDGYCLQSIRGRLSPSLAGFRIITAILPSSGSRNAGLYYPIKIRKGILCFHVMYLVGGTVAFILLGSPDA